MSVGFSDVDSPTAAGDGTIYAVSEALRELVDEDDEETGGSAS